MRWDDRSHHQAERRARTDYVPILSTHPSILFTLLADTHSDDAYAWWQPSIRVRSPVGTKSEIYERMGETPRLEERIADRMDGVERLVDYIIHNRLSNGSPLIGWNRSPSHLISSHHGQSLNCSLLLQIAVGWIESSQQMRYAVIVVYAYLFDWRANNGSHTMFLRIDCKWTSRIEPMGKVGT